MTRRRGPYIKRGDLTYQVSRFIEEPRSDGLPYPRLDDGIAFVGIHIYLGTLEGI